MLNTRDQGHTCSWQLLQQLTSTISVVRSKALRCVLHATLLLGEGTMLLRKCFDEGQSCVTDAES